MSSRRMMTRSSSSNGISTYYNGDDVSGPSRPNSRSYLSNVRPENRSTLCSIIAQFTEETQPSLEVTLKSKAVSEKSNVKFTCVVTGYPIPEVIWYKDDLQLDRYCGLPKYEIFRNGQNHSLHIYNCTVDDAAIYQASASNTKGIVSCSGVLEVGLMNEYKIHQRYFAKLKQKAENKRRELEGKENQGPAGQEPPGNLSPDRSQRKRRSHMVPYFSAPASMEDESSTEEIPEAPEPEAEARLRDSVIGETMEKPAPLSTNGTAAPVIDVKHIQSESGSKGITYDYDSGPKISKAQQPRTPFVKKIKISNCEGGGVGGAMVEGVPEGESEMESARMTQALPELFDSRRPSEEVMEVESSVHSSAPPENTELGLKRESEATLNVGQIPVKQDKLCLDRTVVRSEGTDIPLPEEGSTLNICTADVSPAVSRRKHRSVTETESTEAESQRVGRGETKDLRFQNRPVCKMQRQPKRDTAAQRRPIAADKKEAARRDVRVMDVDSRPTATGHAVPQTCETAAKGLTTVGPRHSDPLPPRPHEAAGRRSPASVDALLDGVDALLLSPCAPPGEETSPVVKNGSVSQPQQLAEVTQLNNNSTPLSLQALLSRSATEAQSPQTTLSEESSHTLNGKQKPTSRQPSQAASGQATQGAWGRSRGSTERHTDLFTDLQTFPVTSPGSRESGPACNITPTVRQSPLEIAMKTVEGQDVRVDRKTGGPEEDTLRGRGENLAVNQRKYETETNGAPMRAIEQVRTGATLDEGKKGSFSCTGTSQSTNKKKPVLKSTVATNPKLQKTNMIHFETGSPQNTMDSGNISVPNTYISEKETKPFKEAPKSVVKVISVSEIMRSQMKALDSRLSNSMTVESTLSTDTPLFTSSTEKQMATEKCPIQDPGERTLDMERTKLESKIETRPCSQQVDLQQRTNKMEYTPEQTLNHTCPATGATQTSWPIHPISAEDLGSNVATGNLSGTMENDSVMDTGHKCGTSSHVPLGDSPDLSLSTDESITTGLHSNASQMEMDGKMNPNLSPSVIITQEHVRSPSSTETRMNSAPVCANASRQCADNSEPYNKKSSHSCDEGLTQISYPEIKPDRGTNWKNPPVFSTTHEGPQMAPETNGGRMETIQGKEMQQENPFSIAEQLTKISCSNDEAQLKGAKNDTLAFPSAIAQELALGARRKVFTPKSSTEDNPTGTPLDSQPQKENTLTKSSKASPGPATLSVPPSPSQPSLSVQPSGGPTAPVRRRSPLLSRKALGLEPTDPAEESMPQSHALRNQEKSAEKEKQDPFKAPQVIRKIRGESFSDALGHLKLWCQFFNVLCDSTISWYRDEVEIAQVKRTMGDESPVNLAILQASKKDCGVYGCRISNEHGTDSTDFLLSFEVLGGLRLREDIGVGEEMEMTPLLLNKGVSDAAVWGNKFFGRIMVQESRVGRGFSHKIWRAKVVYGLEPVFESGTTCIIKMCNPITYGGKGDGQLTERNLDVERQKCRIQSLAREYCKVFSAEARVIENFGPSLEVMPVYLMYRPANTIPYATVEADLKGVYRKYSEVNAVGRLVMTTGSEVELKCCALQHWLHQWTSGNLLLTQLRGVDNKLTNVGVSVKSTGYQGLPAVGEPHIFEQFLSQHQCNDYCGLLGLRSLKASDSLQTPSKPRGPKSPLLQRKKAAGASSPQTSRKAAGSPRLPGKPDSEQDKRRSPLKQKECTVTETSS